MGLASSEAERLLRKIVPIGPKFNSGIQREFLAPNKKLACMSNFDFS